METFIEICTFLVEHGKLMGYVVSISVFFYFMHEIFTVFAAFH
jgi:hypothetical protein